MLIALFVIVYDRPLSAQPFTFVQTQEKVHLHTALLYDLLPGGGHFYTGNYEHAAVFAMLKISGVYAMYHYYHYWQYRGSLYRSAKKANEAIDPNHHLLFKDPEGGYKTVGEFGYAHDRAAHYFTLSIIANAAVYFVSWLVTYYHVEKINDARQPTYAGYNARLFFGADARGSFFAGCTMRW